MRGILGVMFKGRGIEPFVGVLILALGLLQVVVFNYRMQAVISAAMLLALAAAALLLVYKAHRKAHRSKTRAAGDQAAYDERSAALGREHSEESAALGRGYGGRPAAIFILIIICAGLEIFWLTNMGVVFTANIAAAALAMWIGGGLVFIRSEGCQPGKRRITLRVSAIILSVVFAGITVVFSWPRNFAPARTWEDWKYETTPMNAEMITQRMNEYVSDGEIAGAALIVRKSGEIVYQNKWGFSNIETKMPVEYDAIYRMMSMTKPVTAVAVMMLVEQGKLSLDDPVVKYIPSFAGCRVVDERFEGYVLKCAIWNYITVKCGGINSVPLVRDFTIRDLLSHAAGLEEGVIGVMASKANEGISDNLEERMERYADAMLDFQPGTATGYSAFAGFDVLARIVEIAGGQTFDVFLKEHIFIPLGMTDAAFRLSGEQESRLVQNYKRVDGKLVNVTGTDDDICGKITSDRLWSGSAGLYCTIGDYDRFGQMLANGGTLDGVQILKPESVALMHTEAQQKHLEFEAGSVWGLGVMIRQRPEQSGSFACTGTYGWSGMYGTHFFICPEENIEVVFVTNRPGIGGEVSPISRKVEELAFGIYSEQRTQRAR
jgi:CubicO group peptidase (beta-lactamase class C family)